MLAGLVPRFFYTSTVLMGGAGCRFIYEITAASKVANCEHLGSRSCMWNRFKSCCIL